jgi:hypothetical protein
MAEENDHLEICVHRKRNRRFNWRSKGTLKNLGWNSLNSRTKQHELLHGSLPTAAIITLLFACVRTDYRRPVFKNYKAVQRPVSRRRYCNRRNIRVCMTSTMKVQISVNDAWQRTPAVHCVSWVHLTKRYYLLDETAEQHVTLLINQGMGCIIFLTYLLTLNHAADSLYAKYFSHYICLHVYVLALICSTVSWFISTVVFGDVKISPT